MATTDDPASPTPDAPAMGRALLAWRVSDLQGQVTDLGSQLESASVELTAKQGELNAANLRARYWESQAQTLLAEAAKAREQARAKLRAAWDAGVSTAHRYGDNLIHLQGAQADAAFARCMEKIDAALVPPRTEGQRDTREEPNAT